MAFPFITDAEYMSRNRASLFVRFIELMRSFSHLNAFTDIYGGLWATARENLLFIAPCNLKLDKCLISITRPLVETYLGNIIVELYKDTERIGEYNILSEHTLNQTFVLPMNSTKTRVLENQKFILKITMPISEGDLTNKIKLNCQIVWHARG